MKMYRDLIVLLALMLMGLAMPTIAKTNLPEKVVEGSFQRGCVSLDNVALCRRKVGSNPDDIVSLRINGREVFLFDGYYGDGFYSYQIRRRHGNYEVGVGWPGLSGMPMGISDSVEFELLPAGIGLRRILGSGFFKCQGVEEALSYFINLRQRRPELVMQNFDGSRKVVYQLKHSTLARAPNKSSYYRHTIYNPNVDYQQLCVVD